MVEYSYGGLLNNNVYANNKKKKEESENFAKGLLNDPAYINAKAKNEETMGILRNPTPNNIQQRVNAYQNVTDENMQYPPEVLAEPKKVNMLQEYLFGNPNGFQPSVDQKKLVYKATKNLSTAEKLFFQSNPEKFNEYMMKFGDFAPDKTQIAGSQNAVSYNDLSTLGKNNMDFMGMANVNSTYAKMMIGQGADPREFDVNATVHGTTPTDRTEGGQTYSYAQWNSLNIQKNQTSKIGAIENEKKRGEQGYLTVQSPIYNDDGTTSWGEPVNVTLRPSDEALDTAFNKEVRLKWGIQGGFANEEANIRNFNEVIDILDNPNAISSGMAFEVTPEKITRLIESGYKAEEDENGKAYEINNTLDLVRAVVFQSLKKTLGGQFTEREAQRLVEATFNPSLPPEQNIKRILALRDKMLTMFRTQQKAIEYYNKNNTLYGYDTMIGSIDIANLKEMSISDFTDQTVQEMYSSNLDFYKGLVLTSADGTQDFSRVNSYYDSAGVLEKAFIDKIFIKKK